MERQLDTSGVRRSSKSVMKGQVIRPTSGYWPIILRIDTSSVTGSKGPDIDLFLSTGDISGDEFEIATKWLAELPTDIKRARNTIPQVENFLKTIQGANGMIVLIDIARHIRSKKASVNQVLESFADQITAICDGVEEASLGQGGRIGSVFFAFGKRDLHGLNEEEISPIFE